MAQKMKRSLFSKFFGNEKEIELPKNQQQTVTELKFINGYVPIFTKYDNNYYDDVDVRSCIDAIARNGAKLSPKHIRKDAKGFVNVNDNIQKLISKQPNELMNGYKFYYYIISQLFLYNNAYIYILRDENLRVVGLYPLNYQTLKFYEVGKDKDIYIKFNFGAGKSRFVALKDVIHLERFIGKEGLNGGNNAPLTKVLSIKHVIDEGIINAIKTSQSIKGVLKSTKSILNPNDVKAMRDQFVKDFISEGDASGIGGLDATTDFKSIELNPKTAEEAQIKSVDSKLLSYFGISDNIVQSKYSEDDWNAFYESVIEPIGLQMGLEFSNKLFTITEINHGNEIIFTSNRLQYASNNTKINLLRYANNYLTVNEMREVLNLEPVEDGDKILQDLNHINSDIADAYQSGGGD